VGVIRPNEYHGDGNHSALFVSWLIVLPTNTFLLAGGVLLLTAFGCHADQQAARSTEIKAAASAKAVVPAPTHSAARAVSF
jgi:hypothetical protein